MDRTAGYRACRQAATSSRSSRSARPTAIKRQDPYNKLFEDRIIFLGVQVDDASADDIMAQLIVLESRRTPTATSSCTSTRPAARSPR